MITALYAALLAAVMIGLSIGVIRQRRKEKIRYADGGVDGLIVARSAHSNAVENIPIALILMALVEYNGASLWMIHLCGSLLVIGRILHAKGMLAKTIKGRFSGMLITFIVIVTLIILNLVYLPFDKFL